MEELTLENFRALIDDLYTFQLASDSRTMATLTGHVKITEECGTQSTFYRLRAAGKPTLQTQNIAEITRRYWEIVYGYGDNG